MNEPIAGQYPERARTLWLFREVEDGRLWEIGYPESPKSVKHMKGFYDFRYAIVRPWENVPLLSLPTCGLGEDAEGATMQRTLPSKNPSPTKDGFYVTDGPWPGFNSDPLLDKKGHRDVQRYIELLKARYERLIDAQDFEAAALVDAEIERIEDFHRKECAKYAPWKKLTDGDPLNPAFDAARARKYRAVRELDKSGLPTFADHFRKFYTASPRSVIYRPLPEPAWEL